jgi:hypothetical protein
MLAVMAKSVISLQSNRSHQSMAPKKVYKPIYTHYQNCNNYLVRISIKIYLSAFEILSSWLIRLP